MHFCIQCSGSFYPVQCAFYFAVGIFHTASGGWVVAAFQFNDIAGFVFHHFVALNNIRMFQAYFFTRFQTEEFVVGFFFEVFLFDVDFSAERNFISAQLRFVWIDFCIQIFNLPFRIVGNGNFQRIQYHHSTACVHVQVFTQAVFQHTEFYAAVGFGYTNHITEIANGFRCIAATAHTGNGRHTRIIPAIYNAFIHQFFQFAFAGDGIIQLQTRKLILMRTAWKLCKFGQVVQHPVIQWAMVFKF